MTDLKLQEKLSFYINKRNEIESNNYKAEEIEAKVEAYRQELIAQVNAEAKKDLDKINSYIEVLSELIAEDVESKVEEEKPIENFEVDVNQPEIEVEIEPNVEVKDVE